VPKARLRRDGGGDDAASAGGNQQVPTAAGESDPEGPVWQGGAFRRDAWTTWDGEAALPEGPVILPKKLWLAGRDRLAGRNAPLGLLIAPGEAIDDIAADLPHFALIALSFPRFTDGRAFSIARLLREKHGFAGELRAVGNVLTDQIPLMRRVGFDSFEVAHAPTRRALAEGRIPEVKLYYQPTGTDAPPPATRPWLRRRAD
jgi:phosphoadenosine phosphosulfate reductase